MRARSGSFLVCVMLTALVATSLRAQMAKPMKYPRSGPVALVRSDDLVYIFRGTGTGDFLEIYHPLLGVLGTAPGTTDEGQAALIAGDRILIADSGGVLFIPASSATTGSWAKLSISYILDNNLALVPFPDGSILMAGGYELILTPFGAAALFYASSYLIDPDSLKPYPVGSLNTERSAPMVRLRDGDVLAAGGGNGTVFAGNALNTAELYDPARREWIRTGTLQRISGSSALLALADGGALARGLTSRASANPSAPVVERYDARTRQWSVIPGLAPPPSAAIVELPNGKILFSGGGQTTYLATNTIFDPFDSSVRSGTPLLIARGAHAPAVLHDGTVLLIGGATPVGVTNTIERYAWEPRIMRPLDSGFYVATAEQSPAGNDGFWSLEARTSDAVTGGIAYGGVLAGGGKDVAFTAFTISQTQVVSGSVTIGQYTSGTGPLDITLQILDVQRKPVGSAFTGTGTLQWSRELPPGYYIIETRSGASTPSASVQALISASRMEGGVSAGGSLLRSLGITGYLGFALASTQDAIVNLYNSNTFGYPRGAGEVILTLYDTKRNVLKRTGPGAEYLP